MEKKIKKLNNHYIICGAGDIGKHVINEFIKTKNPFVVIEKNQKKMDQLQERVGDILYVLGDATSDLILQKAGIQSARGIITTFASDKDNLFVVFTARSLNTNIRIVSRSLEEETENKLYRAGADSVISAHLIGGMRMASEMLRPAVVSFLDVMLRGKEKVLRVEEATIEEGSKFENITLQEANIPQKTGLIVIAIKRKDTGEYIYNPQSQLELKAKDVLIMMGEVDQVKKLREYTIA